MQCHNESTVSGFEGDEYQSLLTTNCQRGPLNRYPVISDIACSN